MTLLEPYNLPFAIAFMALFVIGALQVFGAGDMLDFGADVEIDMDADIADGLDASGFMDGLFSVLGIGKVPFLIWLACLLFIFATIGVIGQAVIAGMVGAPLSAGIAALVALAAALPINGIAVRPIARLLPKDETTAVSLESLVRRDAVIQTGTARAASPARAKVKDAFGHPHFVMVEPHDEGAELAEGETVLLVRREGQVFFGVPYQSTLLRP